MLENTEGALKNGQSRETGNIGYTIHRTKTNKVKTQHNMCNVSCPEKSYKSQSIHRHYDSIILYHTSFSIVTAVEHVCFPLLCI